MRNMDEISLNFLGLENDAPTIRVFVAEYEQEAIEEDGVYVYRLGVDDPDEYKLYRVSFSEREDFEEYTCGVEENNDLTKKWIWWLFKQKLEASQSNDFLASNSRSQFESSLEFIIERTSLGDQLIVVTPYFLKSK